MEIKLVKAVIKIFSVLKIRCFWKWNFVFDGFWTAFIYFPTQRDA